MGLIYVADDDGSATLANIKTAIKGHTYEALVHETLKDKRTDIGAKLSPGRVVVCSYCPDWFGIITAVDLAPHFCTRPFCHGTLVSLVDGQGVRRCLCSTRIGSMDDTGWVRNALGRSPIAEKHMLSVEEAAKLEKEGLGIGKAIKVTVRDHIPRTVYIAQRIDGSVMQSTAQSSAPHFFTSEDAVLQALATERAIPSNSTDVLLLNRVPWVTGQNSNQVSSVVVLPYATYVWFSDKTWTASLDVPV